MKLDNKDLDIIKILYHANPEDEYTTSYIAKQVYEFEDKRDIKNYDTKVRSRLQKMASYGIVQEEDDNGGPKTYGLRVDNILYGETTIDMVSQVGEESEDFLFSTPLLAVKDDDKDGFHLHGFLPYSDAGG